MKQLVSALVLLLAACAPLPQEPTVVFLVRHAEKVDASRDPELSPAGRMRARALVRVLGDAGIQQVHSTDYLRTRDTAAPLAEELGVETRLYDPRDLDALVETLRAAGGRHLVVGHSNTTPVVVGLLGGEPGDPIEEKSEYDRLYVVWVRGEVVSTSLLRYGESAR